MPSLSLSLSQQQFSNQLAVLKQAAEVGKGMSDFVLVDQEQELEQEFDEEAHEGYEDPGTENAVYEDQSGHYEEDAGDAATAGISHFDDAIPQGEHDQEYQEADENAGEEYAEDSAGVPEQRDAAAADAQQQPSASLENGDHPGDRLDEVNAPDVGAAEDSPAEERPAVDEAGSPAGGVHDKAVSTASSETVQGDVVNSSTGEYDEDIIDWDEDSSLTSFHPEPVVDGTEDLTAFLSQEKADSAKIAEQADQVEPATVELRQQSGIEDNEPDPSADPVLALDDQTHILSSYDFDEYAVVHDVQDDVAEVAKGFFEENNLENVDQQGEQYDQTDPNEEQYEAGFQPGEDDEQFHTAQDFLQGEDYEHGLEHIPDGEDYTGADSTGNDLTAAGDAGDDQESGQLDFGDDIGFDDETTEQYEARQASVPDITGPTAASNSPLGKRSYDEQADDDFDLDEPEAKKARSE